jgi:hypothetical protein
MQFIWNISRSLHHAQYVSSDLFFSFNQVCHLSKSLMDERVHGRFISSQPKFGYTLIYRLCNKNCPKLPTSTKICPKTISLVNFETPPKIGILVILKKKINLQKRHHSMCLVFKFFIQEFLICLFYCLKTASTYEFQYTLLWN